MDVSFSPAGNEFSIATPEGVSIFAKDSNTFAPVSLSESATPDNILKALKIDNYFKRVTGRGATDEEVRDFINMYHDLQREATPTAKQLREGGFETTEISPDGQAMAFAEDRAPVEAGAMQTVEKAGLIMQALGMGQ